MSKRKIIVCKSVGHVGGVSYGILRLRIQDSSSKHYRVVHDSVNFIQKHERLPHASNSVASLPILIKFEFKFKFVTDKHEQLHRICCAF